MSRASNLAGFITAISPTTNLNVGVLTATTFDLGGTISFDDIAATGNIAIGGTVAGVTTITGTGINQPLGINTLGQTEFKGPVEFKDNVSSITVSGIGTFNKVAIGTNNPGGANLAIVSPGNASFSIGQRVDGTGADHLGIYYNASGASIFTSNGDMNFWVDGAGGQTGADFRFGRGFGLEQWVIINDSGSVGVGTTAPTVSVDISEKTDAVALPVGTTAQRPSTAYGGYIRWNSTSSALEVYNGTNWVEIISDYFPSGSTTLG